MPAHPRVLTVTRRTIRKNKYIDYTGEYHLELLMQLGVLPVMVPVARGTLAYLRDYRKPMHGLLLVEGEDIEPAHFKTRKTNYTYLEKTHPLKDAVEMNLLHYALEKRIPILGICRGSQLLNVVCGGTLFGDVQKEKRSHRPHIDSHHYDTYRHPLTIVKDTPLYRWYRKTGIQVNSYHHQGLRDLAPRFRVMGYADDGLVEGFYDPAARFTVGLQFHPERMLPEYRGNREVWKAFTAAVHAQARP